MTLGVYSYAKEPEDGYTYRISHPLAKWVIDKATREHTPQAEVEFDYSQTETKISVIEQNVGSSGYLAARFVRYSSLNETEEHIILAATDDDGNSMDDDFARRLLSVPAKVISNSFIMQELSVCTLLESRQTELNNLLEIRNSDLVNEEVIKIENWAEDNRKELQLVLNELDKAIDEKNSEFIKERNIRKKLASQKEKDTLADRRDASWREYDEQREELKEIRRAHV